MKEHMTISEARKQITARAYRTFSVSSEDNLHFCINGACSGFYVRFESLSIFDSPSMVFLSKPDGSYASIEGVDTVSIRYDIVQGVDCIRFFCEDEAGVSKSCTILAKYK